MVLVELVISSEVFHAHNVGTADDGWRAPWWGWPPTAGSSFRMLWWWISFYDIGTRNIINEWTDILSVNRFEIKQR